MPNLDRITKNADVMGGQACIRGMRVTASVIAEMVRHGHSADEMLAAYPYLEREDIVQALRYETRTWGTVCLICEIVSFALIFCCFLVFRFNLPHHALLAFDGPAPASCVRIVLFSVVPALCGLFMDRSPNRSIAALVLVFPELVMMGILDGHW